jgi:phage FluMu protein Com
MPMSNFQLNCNRCHTTYSIGPFVGLEVQCPKCKAVNRVDYDPYDRPILGAEISPPVDEPLIITIDRVSDDPPS